MTIDSMTSGSHPDTMSIGQLMVAAPSGGTNALVLTTAGTNVPLSVWSYATVSRGGSLQVLNGAVQIGYSLAVQGELSLAHASSFLLVTNDVFSRVNIQQGSFRQSAGTMISRHLRITDWMSNEVMRASVFLSGGKQVILERLEVGCGLVSNTGVLQITGGEMVTTNADAEFAAKIGVDGAGEVLLSGGMWRAGSIYLAAQSNTAGSFLMTGGQLLAPQGDFIIGQYGQGRMTVSNGTWEADNVKVGNARGIGQWGRNTAIGQGSLTVAGGSVRVAGDFNVGGHPQSLATRGRGEVRVKKAGFFI
ncbi:MAG: hypothetical protein ACOYMV_12190 [Verrucomicrobiia bacterium]